MNELITTLPTKWSTIPRGITDVIKENEVLRGIVAKQSSELEQFRAERNAANAKLLSADEIRNKLTPIIQSEVGYFHSRAKLSGPQGIMLSLGNLLNVLRNATTITGEHHYYQKLFACCDGALDQAMIDYQNANFTGEMRVCRFVQVQLGELVNRGYGAYNLETYEQIVLEQQQENTQQQPGRV